MSTHFSALNSDGKSVVVCSTGIGGPSTSIAVEELAQLGVTTFLRVAIIWCNPAKHQPWRHDCKITGSVRLGWCKSALCSNGIPCSGRLRCCDSNEKQACDEAHAVVHRCNCTQVILSTQVKSVTTHFQAMLFVVSKAR